MYRSRLGAKDLFLWALSLMRSAGSALLLPHLTESRLL